MYNPPGSTLFESPLMLQFIESLPTLNPALRKVAEFILRDPLQAATMNIHELGTGTRTSTAAVNRLAKALGFSGFIGLRAAMLLNLREWVAVDADKREPIVGEFSLEQHIRQAKHNLDAVIDSNPAAVFDAVVDALDSAKRLYIVGFGNSFHLAGLLACSLLPLGFNGVVISTDGSIDITAHRIAPITADDVLVALSLPSYTRETVHLARYARSNGARVVALTDGPASPLVALADHSLYAPPYHPVLNNSKGALLGVIEALVAVIQRRHQPRIDLAMEQARRAQTYIDGADQSAIDTSTTSDPGAEGGSGA